MYIVILQPEGLALPPPKYLFIYLFGRWGVVVSREQECRKEQRGRQRENPKQSPWAQCRALSKVHDASWNQVSETQLTEPPKHLYSLKVFKNFILFVFNL